MDETERSFLLPIRSNEASDSLICANCGLGPGEYPIRNIRTNVVKAFCLPCYDIGMWSSEDELPPSMIYLIETDFEPKRS